MRVSPFCLSNFGGKILQQTSFKISLSQSLISISSIDHAYKLNLKKFFSQERRITTLIQKSPFK